MAKFYQAFQEQVPFRKRLPRRDKFQRRFQAALRRRKFGNLDGPNEAAMGTRCRQGPEPHAGQGISRKHGRRLPPAQNSFQCRFRPTGTLGIHQGWLVSQRAIPDIEKPWGEGRPWRQRKGRRTRSRNRKSVKFQPRSRGTCTASNQKIKRFRAKTCAQPRARQPVPDIRANKNPALRMPREIGRNLFKLRSLMNTHNELQGLVLPLAHSCNRRLIAAARQTSHQLHGCGRKIAIFRDIDQTHMAKERQPPRSQSYLQDIAQIGNRRPAFRPLQPLCGGLRENTCSRVATIRCEPCPCTPPGLGPETPHLVPPTFADSESKVIVSMAAYQPALSMEGR